MTATDGPTRTLVLTEAQFRAVLVGVGATDDERCALGAYAIVSGIAAATAAPTITMTDPTPGRAAADAELDAERLTLRQTLNELRRGVRRALGPWHADDGAVPDAALVEYVADAVRAAERGRAPVDDERGRRVGHVLEAAEALVDSYGPEHRIGERGRMLVDAVEALREYTPAEVAAPADTEPAPAAGPSVRDDLHDLAPLPWTTRGGEFLVDAEGRDVFEASIGLDVDRWNRAVLTLAAVVNTESVAGPSPAGRAVIDAARAYRDTWRIGANWARSRDAVFAAVDALDKAASPGGAA